MTTKEFAKMLNDREYGYPQFTKEELQIAKDNGYVIVYGASDDLMEFDGAIREEAGCFDGGKVYFDKQGNLYEEPNANCRCIEALWCDDGVRDENGSIVTWGYKTDIPHETFMINDCNESYCKGIVFSLEDI